MRFTLIKLIDVGNELSKLAIGLGVLEINLISDSASKNSGGKSMQWILPQNLAKASHGDVSVALLRV